MLDDLKKAATDPEKILTTLTSFAPIAKKIALRKMQKDLEPKIEKQGLDWEDIVTAVESVTLDDLKAAGADADKILSMLTSFTPIAKKVALHKLRLVLEPKIEKQGLVWADLVTAMDAVSMDDLKEAATDPAKLLTTLTSFTPIAKKVALRQMRKDLEPKIEKQGLVWADLVMAMDAVSMDDLKEAATDPE